MFDHVGIRVSDLGASERFYRTVLSVLGAEPNHADAELIEWQDWDISPTDREHPVTRGLHVGFRAPDRAAVDAFWRAGIDAGQPAATASRRNSVGSCEQNTVTASSRSRASTARRSAFSRRRFALSVFRAW
jgi:catechol 2,3-dioxygenase-like lactoylglutathione lyase family enzyme